MVNALFMFLPPMLWASACITDKVLVDGSGDDSKPAALMAFSGVCNLAFGLLIIGPILLFDGVAMPARGCLMLMLNGASFTTAMILFLEALRVEEVSRVDPWFQSIPAFGLVFAFVFIGERVEWYQVLAIGLVSVGGWYLKSHGRARWGAVRLMLAASILLAINDVWFAGFGRGLGTAQAIFADVMGKAVCCLSLLLGKTARRGFVLGLKTKLRLQSLSDAFAIVADFLFDRAKLYSSVAIVQGVASSQPLFTLLGAALLTRYWPRVLSEEQGVAFWKKTVGIVIVVAGGAILGMTS